MALILEPSTHQMTALVSAEEAVVSGRWLKEGASAAFAEKIADCAEWTSTYPLQKVRKHRRIEAICPMVGPSMADRSFYFAACLMKEREPELPFLDNVLRSAAGLFETEIFASDPRLRCLNLILPGVRGARLLEATDPGRDIKGELLKRGILVGEFFPSCPFATTFNPKLFALRSPSPMYVLRTFIEGDWRFICQIPEWKEIYRERFGEPPSHLRHLGGTWWRLKQKMQWRIDAVRNGINPLREEPVEE